VQEIEGQRQMPTAFAEQALELRKRLAQRSGSDEKRDGAMRLLGETLLYHGQERKQDENGARINDLPFEMVPIRLMGSCAGTHS